MPKVGGKKYSYTRKAWRLLRKPAQSQASQ